MLSEFFCLRRARRLQSFHVGDVKIRAEGETFAIGVRRISNCQQERLGGDEGHFRVQNVIALPAVDDDAEWFERRPLENLPEGVGCHNYIIYRIRKRAESINLLPRFAAIAQSRWRVSNHSHIALREEPRGVGGPCSCGNPRRAEAMREFSALADSRLFCVELKAFS